LLAVLFALSCFVACAGDSRPPPNVLFVLVDDLNCDIACYGVGEVETPNIDALAERGVRFANAYAQGVACNPSRASLLTGRSPAATQVFDNTTHYRDALPDAVTLARHFRDNGYFTAVVGKLSHRGYDDREAWERYGEFRPPPNPAAKSEKTRAAGRRQLDRWAVRGGAENELDYLIASRAIQWLRELERKPFFMAVGFDSPHPPLVAPKPYFDRYRRTRPELPEDFAVLPQLGTPASRANTGLFSGRAASPDEARAMIRAYRATTSFVDAQLGRVLAELDRLELRDDTIIVFASDHGFHLGEKGLWGKSTLYERGLRVPLLIAGPGIAAGVASTRSVQLLDLYPTLVELAGLPAPSRLDGHSLVPLLDDPQAAWSHPALSWLKRGDVFGISARGERYRYTEWDAGAAGRELYDHTSDPHETRNLADDPAQAEVVDRLSAGLRSAASE
jgi:uncharacterized sulfatase